MCDSFLALFAVRHVKYLSTGCSRHRQQPAPAMVQCILLRALQQAFEMVSSACHSWKCGATWKRECLHSASQLLTLRTVGLYGGFIKFAGSAQTFTVPYMGFVGQWPLQGPEGAIATVCSGAPPRAAVIGWPPLRTSALVTASSRWSECCTLGMAC